MDNKESLKKKEPDDQESQKKSPQKRRKTTVQRTVCGRFRNKRKYQLLQRLIETNCNFAEEESQIVKVFKRGSMCTRLTKEFVRQEAQKAQNRVTNELTNQSISESFKNVTKLMEYLEEKSGKSVCKYEIPLALKTITDLEDHPNADLLDGIDLKNLYQTLTNLSMGYPTKELDDKSRAYLHQLYKEVQTKISSPQFADDLGTLQTLIDSSDPNTPPNPNEDAKLLQKMIDSVYTDPALNPFKIPQSEIMEINKKI